MTVKVAFRVNEVVEFAGFMRASADQADGNFTETFDQWVEEAEAIMRDEVPKDTWDTHDSITVERNSKTSATIGPTNRDAQGRPVGFFINYGTASQPPDDFIGRTAERAQEAAGAFTVADVL